MTDAASHRLLFNDRKFATEQRERRALTLAEGTRIFIDRKRDERRQIEKAIDAAKEIFEGHPNGIGERTLIGLVQKQSGVKIRIAAAAVDRLETSGAATKDWSTGLLTPTRTVDGRG